MKRAGRLVRGIAFVILAVTFPANNASHGASDKAPFVLGVGVHLQSGKRQLAKSLDKLAGAGVVALRDDAPWGRVEEQQGELRIPTDWDRLVNEANARGIRVLLILDYGNRFYDDGDKPISPEAVIAFTRYAAFVAGYFKGRVHYYEIWNEWDHRTGNTRPGDAASYVPLAKSVYHAVKEADPGATVLAGAVTPEGIRRGFLAQIVRLGILEAADALSLHTYVHCRRDRAPEDWAAWMREIDRELRRLSGRSISLFITEMGWPSHSGACGISLEEQGRYLARMFLLAKALPFIDGVWWYDLQNDGLDPANREHNFGLLGNDMTPKPAYEALRSISPLVREGRYVGRLDVGVSGIHVLRFEQGTTSVLATWKEDGTPCLAIRLISSTPFRAELWRLSEGQSSVPWKSARVRSDEREKEHYTDIPLSNMPQVFSLSEQSLPLGKLEATCADNR